MVAAKDHVRLSCGLVGWDVVGEKPGFFLVAHCEVDVGVRGGDVEGEIMACYHCTAKWSGPQGSWS